MSVLGRVTTAMVTPFAEDGSLDLDGAHELAGHLVEHGTDTVLICGTTGESPTLTSKESQQLAQVVAEAVAGAGQLMIGAGTNDTARTCASTRRATEAGADAILIVTPYYNRPAQRMLHEHFTSAAGATDLPVIVYDVPGRTACEIGKETLIELAGVENIAGLKDAAGDLAKTAEVVAGTRDAPGGFDVYCGTDELNLPLLSVGAVGFVSVASHLVGPELADMAGTFDTDPAKARHIHASLLPLCRALFGESSPAPLKGAMNRLGLPAGPVRGPLLDARDDIVEDVLAALDHAGVDRGRFTPTRA